MSDLAFVASQEDPAKIGSLGRDLLPMQVAASEFLIDYTSLYFVVSDDEKNIAVYAFDEKGESWTAFRPDVSAIVDAAPSSYRPHVSRRCETRPKSRVPRR